MISLSQYELDNKLSEYQAWLKRESYREKPSFSNLVFNCLDFSGRDLTDVNFIGGKFVSCSFNNATLKDTYFGYTDLYDIKMKDCDLRGGCFYKSKLYNVDFSNSKMGCRTLKDTYLSDINLSGVVGLPTQKEFLSQFKRGPEGLIVYKGFGETTYKPRYNWKIKRGSFLEETPNFTRTDECGCGINFGTVQFITRQYPESKIWECLIHNEDLSDICVPYNTDGKARCGRLQLLRPLPVKEHNKLLAE